MTQTTALPLVSAVIPAYNAAAWIRETIESVLAQDYPALEVIVVDDGSADETAALAGGYGERVRCLRQSNAGQGAARNLGARHATGKYLAFLDSDDLWKPGKTAAQVELLEARPDAALAFCDYEPFGEPGARRGFERAGVLHRLRTERLGEHGKVLTEPDLVTPLLDDMYCQVPTTWMVPRTAFGAVGGFDPSLRRGGEDWLLAARLALHGPLVFDVRPLALRRERTGSHSRQSDGQEGLAAAMKNLLDADMPGETRRALAAVLTAKALVLSQRASSQGDAQAARQWRRMSWAASRHVPLALRWRSRLRGALASIGV